jgi:Tol biopolymer transport system component
MARDWSTAVQHKGDASWHPEGKYFVFVAQNRGSNSYTASLPGTGLNCNLWIGTRSGERPWMITDIPTTNPPRRGVVSPQFSPDGRKLFWAGNLGVDPSGSTLSQRALFLSDFHIEHDGRPVLDKIQTLQPGEMRDFYESSGFTPDGNKVVFSGNLGKDHSVLGMDVYTMDLRTEKIENLTNTPNIWDQYPAVSPDGKKVVWMSSQGLNVRFFGGGPAKWMNYLTSELWIMNANGTEPKQLTRFNTFGAPEHFRRRCFVGDSAWSPDGTQIAICLHKETGGKGLTSEVIILDLGIDPAPQGVQVDWATPTADAEP